MSVDVGFDFRATSTFVTDPANCTYVIDDLYPTTRGGVTFGWAVHRAGARWLAGAARARGSCGPKSIKVA